MYNYPWGYPQYPYYYNGVPYQDNRQPIFWGNTDEIEHFNPFYYSHDHEDYMTLKDYGDNPLVVNIEHATERNNTFRTVLWTGENLQVTLMSIDVGDDIGLEVHPNVDQFLRIEDGEGLVQMGDAKENLSLQRRVDDESAIIVPAGTWHNVINIGNQPLKLYTIYAPPEHPFGTIHRTKAEAIEAEGHH
ncbi:cupin domain-containing protein [Amphibacillus sp. MSJ-3]|uniref:cupin domain-containing protein n=1 Tax=Amphibacillus sp. MSJ-3 TaxID=2841505 RepID=UPI001C0F2623|nr:cupin domain-containing protein [Amphibacillus sp. MSJ-3]